MLFGLHKIYKQDSEKSDNEAKKEENKQEADQIMQIDSKMIEEKPKVQENIPFVWIHDVASGSPAE